MYSERQLTLYEEMVGLARRTTMAVEALAQSNIAPSLTSQSLTQNEVFSVDSVIQFQ